MKRAASVQYRNTAFNFTNETKTKGEGGGKSGFEKRPHGRASSETLIGQMGSHGRHGG